jgi:hypothetical protein
MILTPEILIEWFKMSDSDILNKFYDLSPKTQVYGEGSYQSLFIPGTRDDRVLLVAHVDTYWGKDQEKVSIDLNDGFLASGKKFFRCENGVRTNHMLGMGIGADDRAGVAILWHLRNLGHSILLTGMEERGCVGSSFIMLREDASKLMQKHNFAVQFDRRNINDLVFYNVGTGKFINYCEEMTGYKWAQGTFSDIGVLCKKICGVNMSVGYFNEHSPYEILHLASVNKTCSIAYNWLSKKNLPKFPL